MSSVATSRSEKWLFQTLDFAEILNGLVHWLTAIKTDKTSKS